MDCAIENCPNQAVTRGYCEKHYRRLIRHGGPLEGSTFHGLSDSERIALRVREGIRQQNGCLFTKRRNRSYPVFHGSDGTCGPFSRALMQDCLGRPLTTTEQVLHRCDTPPCIEITHLFIGTHGDNMDDKTRKGRALQKLTRAAVKRIHELRSQGRSQESIGKIIGVNQARISQILRTNWWPQ